MTAPLVGRLLELAVSDLAVIERVRIALGPGLNVISGETGAGKSLLIDALGLALGERADTSLVRHGADFARVEALFDRVPEPLIVVREVTGLGRSTARLDDEPVTAARLAETSGALVEIHGQHEQQRLLDECVQRDLVDAYAGCLPARALVSEAVERWRDNRDALDRLAIEPREQARRLELAEHEAAEIGAARLRPGEADGIRLVLDGMRNAEAIARGGAALREQLVGEGSGARDSLGGAVRQATDLGRLDPRFEQLAERLRVLAVEVDDLGTDVRSLVESVDHDPADVARLEERLSLIYSLERRYGDDEAAVIAHGEQMTAEAERLRGVEGERARRGAEQALLLADVGRSAAALSELRAAAATELSSAVDEALEGLGLGGARFEIALGRRPAGTGEAAVEIDGDALAFDGSGIDQVVFRFAPNVGEPPRPLARIASGGELSRVALAIKQVLASADATPTLVFDEIDSGIGGRSADPIGRSLWALARSHQVLCVTHLPQIAAHADAHFRIEKREQGGRTITDLRRLEPDERVDELALMLAGSAGGETARSGARELLDRAEAWQREAAAASEPAVVA